MVRTCYTAIIIITYIITVITDIIVTHIIIVIIAHITVIIILLLYRRALSSTSSGPEAKGVYGLSQEQKVGQEVSWRRWECRFAQIRLLLRYISGWYTMH